MAEVRDHHAPRQLEAVVIGGSSGGFEALHTLLQALPADCPYAILVVLHRGAAPDPLLSSLLARNCRLAVKEAEEKEPILPGTVYLAPPNYHLLVELDQSISLTVDNRVCFARPSIDVLFETAADAYQDRLIAVLLTGANNDGTAGMIRVKARGGITIAQEPTTAHAPAMPASAIRAGAVQHVHALGDISSILSQYCTPTSTPAGQGVVNERPHSS